MIRADRLALLAFALAACSSASAGVRPFEDIQATDPVFENDPTFPGRAVLHVTTTEPAICAVVWGETEELGSFNNSLSMNGTGISEHDVLLPGAEPGRTYYYVLQGTTADGTLYRSELTTFTLPPAAEAPVPSGENLAIGAEVVEVSSEFGESWVASHAVDGDLGTEWSSRGDGDDASLTINLGEPVEVGFVEFLTRSMADGSATTTTFTVTVDSAVFGPFPAGNPGERRPAPVGAVGQVLTFAVETSTGGNTGAVEVGVYAP